MASKIEEKHEKVMSMLSNIDEGLEQIKMDGLVMRFGGKLFKLTVEQEVSTDFVEEMKSELRAKAREVLLKIRDQVNQDVSELKQAAIAAKSEYEQKEKDLRDQLAKAKPMPEIYASHAGLGVSCVKGESTNELIWLVRSVYMPLTLDQKPIDPKMVKRLTSPVVFYIKTDMRDGRILEMSTRKPNITQYFEHYHQSHPDCWGNWRDRVYSYRVRTPDDALRTADEARGVLGNINSGSLATRTPRGLPTYHTVAEALKKVSDAEKRKLIKNIEKDLNGNGLSLSDGESGDVWTVSWQG